MEITCAQAGDVEHRGHLLEWGGVRGQECFGE